jgi:hypothetical protein
MIRTLLFALILAAAGLAAMPRLGSAGSAPAEKKVYQLRTYSTAPGKLGVLIDRFRKHNLAIFQRNGITLVGAWTPVGKDEPERLVYLVSFPSREAADRAWKAFGEDPEWKEVFAKEKAAHGTVVARVETVYLEPTDYSPAAEPRQVPGEGRAFELRTYTASPGKLDALNKRFRDHSLKLLQKHGMTNILYTMPLEEGKGAGDTLIYLLAHPSREAADRAWQSFRDDPEWQRVSKESQPDGVRLAAKVVAVFLRPTDFSPIR